MKNLTVRSAIFYILCALFLGLFHAAFAQTYCMEQISENPRVFIISDFLSDEECNYMISYARAQMSRSTVFDEKTNQRKIVPNRTSTSMRCSDQHEDKIIQQIEKRISAITSLNALQGENIQVAHYEIGDKFSAHYDYFMNTTSQEGGQRIASFLVYLNTPIKGGETNFPLANISISPIKGKALFFYNVDKNGSVDGLTLHEGSVIIEGEKWIMTRWFREKNLPYIQRGPKS